MRTLPALALGVLAPAMLLLSGCSSQGSVQPVAAASQAAPAPAAHPDLSGFWNLDMKVPRDAALMALVPPNTVFMDDTGPVEFPAGTYGGLIPTPAAQAAIKKWNPRDQLKPERLPATVHRLRPAGPLPHRDLAE